MSRGEGEAFEALRREQLIAYQMERQIDPSLKATELPEGLVEILKEELAGMQYYGCSGSMERLSLYEDEEHRLTLEQVRAYLGEENSDYYDIESIGAISCAYFADLDRDGNEELVLFYYSGGSGGFASVDIWRKQEGDAAELLYCIDYLLAYAALLDYEDTYYFVVRQFNPYTGERTGFYVLTAGENGTLKQYLIGLDNKDNQKEWIETFHAEGMDSGLEQRLADCIQARKKEVEEKTVSNDDYKLIEGSAETPWQEADIAFSLEAFYLSKYEEQSCRIVDFDNDGRLECVKKMIWYPGSLTTTVGLITDFYKEYDSYVHKTEVIFPRFSNPYGDSDSFGTAVAAEETFPKEPVQLWFEELDQKVYTFYLYRIEASSDYLLEISLIEGEKLHPLLQYLLIAEKEYTYEQIEF